MKCPRCEQENPPQAKFCLECGTPLAGAPQAKPYADLEAENASLRRSVTTALEQQTATAEILRVISGSQADIQPVFDTIVRSAARLCDGMFATLFRFDGELLHWVSQHNSTPEGIDAMQRRWPRPPGPETIVGRAVIDRTVIHVRDSESDPDAPVETREIARAFGYRSVISVPMLREGQPVGGLSVARRDQPFTPAQISLLQTFADQAVIAIENVRLFTKLEATNRELTTALDQQTATSEILRVISRSLTDVRPVFNTVVQSGLRLLGGYSATMMLLRDDDRLDLVAYTSTSAEADASLVHAFPLPLRRIPAGERALHERHAHAVEDVESAHDATDVMRETGRARGWRSNLFVPMIRDEVSVGLISITRREPGPFAADQIALLEIFAAQAVIAIENVRLFNETKEALEQQTATSEILKVISSSPTDLQPVLDTVVKSAARFCGAHDAVLFRRDGETLTLAAHHGPLRAPIGLLVPVVRGTVGGRSVLERRAIHAPDVQAEAEVFPESSAFARDIGPRTILAAPLLREGEAIGTIQLRRLAVEPFTDKQVALLQTFADQAVIAIENVRLFTELESRNRDLTEALTRQTATSEILRVISSSPTDVQPVFDAIARNAVTLCGGIRALVLRFDGERLHVAGHHNMSVDVVDRVGQAFPRRPGRDYPPDQALLDRSVVHVPDLQAATEFAASTAWQRGVRSLLAVPLLREQEAVGVISLARDVVGPFSPPQIEVLQTFADQAVIAIENVRMFNELESRNRDLTEALERQTATSEILRVISSFQTDIQPVFDAIAAKALELCRATTGWVYRFDGELIHIAAAHSLRPEAVQVVRESYPMPPSQGGGTARAVLSRALVYIPDIREDQEYRLQSLAHAADYLSVLAVPMLLEQKPIGAVVVTGAEAGAFSKRQIELLQTFADQAVIAVQNAAALPGDRRQEPTARSRQSAQVRVPRQHVPRAADTVERRHRVLRGLDRSNVW